MNIKRAFLAVSAAAMLPGLAMAQLAPTTFPTEVIFSNGYNGTVNVTLTCNSGNPLEQSFQISAANGVDFVVQELDTSSDATRCTIVLGELDDGYITTDVCIFQNNAVPALPFDESGINQCDFLALPVPSVFITTKVWEGDFTDINTTASFSLSCTNASPDPDGLSLLLEFDFIENGPGIEEFEFFPAPGEISVCRVIEDEDLLDSAVDTDQGCADGTAFTIGSGIDGCTITNTVFYEGIPTLSQYGMAIMALLMLGVGFVGFRRLV